MTKIGHSAPLIQRPLFQHAGSAAFSWNNGRRPLPRSLDYPYLPGVTGADGVVGELEVEVGDGQGEGDDHPEGGVLGHRGP